MIIFVGLKKKVLSNLQNWILTGNQLKAFQYEAAGFVMVSLLLIGLLNAVGESM
jgi:hypothetical protein